MEDQNKKAQKINRQSGFTLLEALVTMAIFGMLVAGGVAIIGPIMQDSTLESNAEQIVVGINDIYKASSIYLSRTGSLLTNDASETWKSEMRTKGILTSIPSLKGDVGKDSSYNGTYALTMNSTSYNGWGNASTTDTAIQLNGVSDAICLFINQKFSNMKVTTAIPNAVDYTIDLQCFKSGAANTVVRPLYLDQVKTN